MVGGSLQGDSKGVSNTLGGDQGYLVEQISKIEGQKFTPN